MLYVLRRHIQWIVRMSTEFCYCCLVLVGIFFIYYAVTMELLVHFLFRSVKRLQSAKQFKRKAKSAVGMYFWFSILQSYIVPVQI